MGNVDNWAHRLPLLSGGFFDFKNPARSVYTIEDIARGLSRTFRFAGQTLYPFTVAQHSVILSYMADEGEELAALMHDGFEAGGNDIVRSLKALLPCYQSIENEFMKDLFARVGLSWPLSESVTRKDKELGDLESLFLNGDSGHQPLPNAWRKTIHGKNVWSLSTMESQTVFLERWFELTGKSICTILMKA